MKKLLILSSFLLVSNIVYSQEVTSKLIEKTKYSLLFNELLNVQSNIHLQEEKVSTKDSVLLSQLLNPENDFVPEKTKDSNIIKKTKYSLIFNELLNVQSDINSQEEKVSTKDSVLLSKLLNPE